MYNQYINGFHTWFAWMGGYASFTRFVAQFRLCNWCELSQQSKETFFSSLSSVSWCSYFFGSTVYNDTLLLGLHIRFYSNCNTLQTSSHIHHPSAVVTSPVHQFCASLHHQYSSCRIRGLSSIMNSTLSKICAYYVMLNISLCLSPVSIFSIHPV